jgi:hypothetical protein
MTNPLATLLECADIEGCDAISPTQLIACNLPQPKLPFLKRAATPDIIICSGCHEACLKPYQRKDAQSFVWCDEPPALGYIKLQPEDLQHWKLDMEAFSQILAKNLGLQNTQTIIPNRVYDLGVMEGKTLFLVRGIEWDDIGEIYTDSRICNNSPLLITLSPPPANVTSPMLWAGQLLSLDAKGNITIDIARLRIALGVTPTQANSFYQRGTEWHICYENHAITMRDSKGMAYIQYLLLHPNKEVAAMELNGLCNKTTDTNADFMPFDGRDEIIDTKTIQQIVKHIHTLPANSSKRLELQKTLSKITHGGTSKAFKGANEKARQAVTIAIDRTIKAVDKHHNSLATHLRNNIERGKIYRYQPEKLMRWQ